MAVPNWKKSLGNGASTTLSSSVTNTDTAFPLTSDTAFSGAGMVIIDEGTASEEYAYATGKSGASLTIPLANRGLEGTSAVAHASGATVKAILTSDMWNDVIDGFLTSHADDGTHSASIALTTPKITTSINDANGNEVIKTPATASAVNEVTITNAATGNAPELSATGGDTNIGLNLKPKGSGNVAILDGNGNEVIKTDEVSSAVNEITVTNAATGTSPVISATGGDSNVGLDLKMKGTAYFRKPTVVGIQVVDSATNTSTGDGKAFFRVPAELNGMNLTGVADSVYTAGTTNTTDVQIRNKTDGVDMLSTKLTIDSGETDSSTAATPAVIDTTKDDVATGDILAIDVDAVSTTPAKGLWVELRFELP